MWLSTTKYFSPSFSYMCPPRGSPWMRGGGSRLLLEGRQVEADVLRGVLGIGEHDRPVVLVDHPAVVRRHVLLELRGVVVALLLSQGLGDLVVVEVHPVDAVDADHRGQPGDGDALLGAHHLGDDGTHLVVHQGDAALVRGGVVGLERTLGGRVRRLGRLVATHWVSSFGMSRPRSARMPLNRLLARSRPSSNRGGLASGCDQIGCSSRAAVRHLGTQFESQPAMMSLL